MQYQAHNLCQLCLHLWLLKPLWCTPLHRLFRLPRHPPLHPRGILLRLHHLRRLHHLHRLRHRHLCRVLHTHLTTFNLHNQRTQPSSLQMNLHHQQLRQLPGFALTRKRTDHVDQLRKPLLLLHHRHQRRHRLHPFHLNLQRWDPPHNNLRNRFDLFKLNNN